MKFTSKCSFKFSTRTPPCQPAQPHKPGIQSWKSHQRIRGRIMRTTPVPAEIVVQAKVVSFTPDQSPGRTFTAGRTHIIPCINTLIGFPLDTRMFTRGVSLVKPFLSQPQGVLVLHRSPLLQRYPVNFGGLFKQYLRMELVGKVICGPGGEPDRAGWVGHRDAAGISREISANGVQDRRRQ